MVLKGVFLCDDIEMDYQSLIQLMTSKTVVKKVTPFVLSVSIFSFIFSNPSCNAFLSHFFKFYFSSLPMQVLSHALDKTWIFLICNGILVVIVNTSGVVHSPSEFDLNDLLQKKIVDGLPAPVPDTKDNSLEVLEYSDNAVSELDGEEKENDAITEEDDQCLAEEQEQNSCLVLDVDDEEEEQEPEQESEFFITQGGGEITQELQVSSIMANEENEEESETWFIMEDEEEDHEQLHEDEEEEEGIHKLSTEELNKRFDDFIRKMKEELRIEAQQQLVLVK